MSVEERGDKAGPFDRAYRCTICTLDWPPYEEFEVCPSCGEDCTPFSHMKSMPLTDALHLKRAYEFETFYEEWDRTHDPARLHPEHVADR